ncbi:MAG: serine hydrolase family protein [Candidatus Buchananbacteria bacterium]|nr:serine hydrolase family protein [Candidatus Buchananbacteria bacterium]
MSKRAVIVHCWDGSPDYCWYPATKTQLEQNQFSVTVPAFPETEAPNLAKWLPMLQTVVGTPDENLFLIGHSVGCITILRYLESLAPGQKIGGVVLVAGFTDDLGYDELKNFFQTNIDFQKIKSHCPKFVAIHSDNDPYVDLKHADVFKAELNAEIIVKHQAGHFSGEVDNETSCRNLPEVSDTVLKMINHKQS